MLKLRINSEFAYKNRVTKGRIEIKFKIFYFYPLLANTNL